MTQMRMVSFTDLTPNVTSDVLLNAVCNLTSIFWNLPATFASEWNTVHCAAFNFVIFNSIWCRCLWQRSSSTDCNPLGPRTKQTVCSFPIVTMFSESRLLGSTQPPHGCKTVGDSVPASVGATVGANSSSARHQKYVVAAMSKTILSHWFLNKPVFFKSIC